MVPEAPALVPEAPVMVPEAPVMVPEAPVVVPEAPLVVPEAPLVVPDEVPVMVPEAPMMASTAPALVSEAPVIDMKALTVTRSTPVSLGDPLHTTSFSSAYTDPITGMDFVFVNGGCFTMGSSDCGPFSECSSNEEPAHEVCVDDFWMGKFEVTQSQWQNVMGNNPSRFSGRNRPVEQVSWDDTQDFLRSLNTLSGNNYRLPTEAEWEYAASSGGKDEKWADTDNEALLDGYAWHINNSDGQTHPVGLKRPNGIGLYDMNGNVWEWCSDRYESDYYEKSRKHNPQGPLEGVYRVERGGSWLDKPQYMRLALRNWSRPDYGSNFFGFRLVFPAP